MSQTNTIRRSTRSVLLIVTALFGVLLAFGATTGTAGAQGACEIGNFKNADGTLDTTGYLACLGGASAVQPEQPCPDADLKLLGAVDPTSATPGQTVNFSASGKFGPGSQVTVYLCPGGTALGTFTTDASGNLSVNVTIPSSTPCRQYTLVGVGQRDNGTSQLAFAGITVTCGATTGGLPVTGSDSGRMIGLGAALVVLGGAAVFGSMRARRPATVDAD